MLLRENLKNKFTCWFKIDLFAIVPDVKTHGDCSPVDKYAFRWYKKNDRLG